jgi:hypothetical protein
LFRCGALADLGPIPDAGPFGVRTPMMDWWASTMRPGAHAYEKSIMESNAAPNNVPATGAPLLLFDHKVSLLDV